MRYLSVCSGIEAATVAWHPLGWTPVAFSEIEPFPSAVLAHHYPTVPNYGDMTKFEEWPLEPETVDLLVGGTPCQSFSVAGLRKGISDPRGGLMLTYLEIARRLRPRWIVWENVPGVLSSNGGRDFGSFLGALSELRYGWAYRVIDAQYCRVDRRWPKAVPQRRRRVFVVGCDLERNPRGRECAAEVLALGTGLRSHLAESGKAREAAPADAEAGAGAGCWPATVASTLTHDFGDKLGQNNQHALNGAALFVRNVVGALTAKGPTAMGAPEVDAQHYVASRAIWWDGSDCAGTLTKQNANDAQRMPDKDNFGAVLQPVPYDLFQITAPVNRQNRRPGDPCHTLARDNAAHAAVAFSSNMSEPDCQTDGTTPTVKVGSGLGIPSPPAVAHAVAPTITAANDPSRSPQSSEVTQQVAAVHAASMTVRRLTPRECERLQAFPDDYTEIPWRGKPADQCPDGPRYKALGNSMACNCMAWIGERIQAVETERLQSLENQG